MTVYDGKKNLITTAQFFALWRVVGELFPDPAAGLNIATQIDVGNRPPSTMAAYFARDYRDALTRLARFKQLCTPEELQIKIGKDDGTITKRLPDRRVEVKIAQKDGKKVKDTAPAIVAESALTVLLTHAERWLTLPTMPRRWLTLPTMPRRTTWSDHRSGRPAPPSRPNRGSARPRRTCTTRVGKSCCVRCRQCEISGEAPVHQAHADFCHEKVVRSSDLACQGSNPHNSAWILTAGQF